MNRRNAVLVAAVALAPAWPRAAFALDTIRVATGPVDAALEAAYAQRLGFAAEAGLDCTIELLGSGAANVAAVLGGAVDIGLSNVLTVLAAHERGVPLGIVAAAAVYSSKNPTSVLLVPDDSPVRSARDLNGRYVAVSALRDITQFAPMAWMDANGGDAKSVHFVEIPFPAMPVALAEHRVDAAFITEPFATRAKDHARVLAPAFDAIAPQFQISVYAASFSWTAAHPELARRFAALIYRTGAYANVNRTRTGEFLMQIAKIDADQLKITPRATYAEHADPAAIKPVIDVALKYGAIAAPVAPASLFSPEVLRS
ncbi:MAG TPA: ABC transporter substrate-binding protein [Candidatus Acidoferrales bacterium]|nr:ABC transporter substrate-binding protein [Candidatus Acidoferrales bacterium]